MNGDQIIEDILKAFGIYALGDIRHNADRTISCFILCSCFIDQLAGYRYNSKHNGRFEKFIKEYLPQYGSLRLYDTLRNKIVHNYSVENAYKLTSDHNYIENATGAKNLDVLCTHTFIRELEQVFNKIEIEFKQEGESRKNAILRNIDYPILTHQIYNIMDYTNEEADFLIGYYSPLMIGKYLDDSKQLKVVEIVKKSETGGKSYMVAALSNKMETVFQFFREISLAAKYFNMEDPEEVLKRRN